MRFGWIGSMGLWTSYPGDVAKLEQLMSQHNNPFQSAIEKKILLLEFRKDIAFGMIKDITLNAWWLIFSYIIVTLLLKYYYLEYLILNYVFELYTLLFKCLMIWSYTVGKGLKKEERIDHFVLNWNWKVKDL